MRSKLLVMCCTVSCISLSVFTWSIKANIDLNSSLNSNLAMVSSLCGTNKQMYASSYGLISVWNKQKYYSSFKLVYCIGL